MDIVSVALEQLNLKCSLQACNLGEAQAASLISACCVSLIQSQPLPSFGLCLVLVTPVLWTLFRPVQICEVRLYQDRPQDYISEQDRTHTISFIRSLHRVAPSLRYLTLLPNKGIQVLIHTLTRTITEVSRVCSRD